MSPKLMTSSSTAPWVSPRTASLGVILLVFLCGAVAGAVAMTLGAHNMLHPAPFWKESAKAEYLRTVQRELDLTPEQTQQMSSILDDFAKYYQTVLSDGKARILNILNDEQKRKFQRMLKERGR
jgi:Spy/CpxP family protein refolding chaperone